MSLQIPKKMHIIWVGDDAKRPDKWIATWRDQHPSWEFKLWGNDDFHSIDWINRRHLQSLWKVQDWAGVADLMRYEILYRHGGIYVDADSICVRPLDDWLLEGEFFAVWDGDIGRQLGRLITNSFLGATSGNEFLRYLIAHIKAKPDVTKRRWSWRNFRFRRLKAWKIVGPTPLTECLKSSGYAGATLLPSHMFIPEHKSGTKYSGGGLVYARHFGGTTKHLYGQTAASSS